MANKVNLYMHEILNKVSAKNKKADKIQLLKEQIQQEVKEKYQLYETIKQLGGMNGQKENQKATEEVGS